ncbi:flippase [Calidifontibacillus oryziterrae]|uniref:flippase n=1 Tax=Calidifontibacillus oryziterrae TaxID=1191699 RepID=UPI001E6553F6|nr:flippase [Calidifontibacillus oryziterrae]
MKKLNDSQNKKNFIFKKFIGSFAINFSSVVLNLMVVLILTRIVTPEQLGYYFFAMALVSIATVPTVLGLPNILIRFSSKYIVEKKWGFLKGIVIRLNQIVVIMSIIIITGCYMLIVKAHSMIPALDKNTAFLSLSLIILLALSKIRTSLLRSVGSIYLSQIPDLIIKNLLILAFSVIIYYLMGVDILGIHVMIITVIAALIAFLVGQYFVWIKFPTYVNGHTAEYETKEWLLPAIPLLIAGGMKIINTKTDIIMLGMFTSSEITAVYQIVGKVGEVVLFALSAFNIILAPIISRYFYNNDFSKMQEVVTNATRVITVYSSLILVLFIICGKIILYHAFGEEYANGYSALIILSIGQFVNASLGSVALILTMTGNEKDVAKGVALAAILNIILNFILIPLLEIEGAAIATAISTVIWNLYLAFLVYKRLNIVTIPFTPKKFLKY